MVPGQHGPPGPPANVQMPPPPQPQQGQPGRPQAHGESPSLANAQPPTPTPVNKPPPKKAAKGDRPKRNRGKIAAPATPNASEPPTPTTPITAHPPLPFNQHSQQQTQAAQSQPQPQQTQSEPPHGQDVAPPSSFATIDHAADAANDVWPADDKWMNSIQMDFGNSFSTGLNDFSTTNFGVGEDDIINYGEFLNDNEGGIGMDLGIWEDLPSTEA
jgi:hypothetical protein